MMLLLRKFTVVIAVFRILNPTITVNIAKENKNIYCIQKSFYEKITLFIICD
jgi:hypothetical protein